MPTIWKMSVRFLRGSYQDQACKASVSRLEVLLSLPLYTKVVYDIILSNVLLNESN